MQSREAEQKDRLTVLREAARLGISDVEGPKDTIEVLRLLHDSMDLVHHF